MKHMFQCIMTMKFYREGSELTDRWNFSVTYTRLRNRHLILSTVILATLPNLTQLASTLHYIKWVEFFRCTQLCWLLVVNACPVFFLFYPHHYIVTIWKTATCYPTDSETLPVSVWAYCFWPLIKFPGSVYVVSRSEVGINRLTKSIKSIWSGILFCVQTDTNTQTGIASDVIEQMHTCDNIQSSLCSVFCDWSAHSLFPASHLLDSFVEWFKGKEFTINPPHQCWACNKSEGYKDDSS